MIDDVGLVLLSICLLLSNILRRRLPHHRQFLLVSMEIQHSSGHAWSRSLACLRMEKARKRHGRNLLRPAMLLFHFHVFVINSLK